MSAPVWVVIPAAGVGKRMQSAIPKQYLPLLGKTVLEHTLACFLACPTVAGIVVVVSQGDEYWQALAPAYVGLPVHAAQGGKERADSVLNGLDWLARELAVPAETVVLVHDAARPCLSSQDLHALLAVQGECAAQGALLAMPVRDTMKRAVSGSPHVSHTEDREGLWHALTPQMAALGVLRGALRAALQAGFPVTDEASALEYSGLQPRLVEGDARNIKITRPADLVLAEWLLAAGVG